MYYVERKLQHMDSMNEQNNLFQNKREQRIVFFLVSVGVLTITYGILFMIDFLPEKPSDITVSEIVTVPVEDVISSSDNTTDNMADNMVNIDANPTKIIFESLGKKEIKILNPESRAIADLDEALLSGAVRHPDSADFSKKGTIFLFGHSSYIPNVFNKNFQAFNDIQDLTWGDKIRLQSSDMEYVYRVDRVYQVKASKAEVAIEYGKAKLTLVTCNSFGSKDDRYVVESTLVDSYPINI